MKFYIQNILWCIAFAGIVIIPSEFLIEKTSKTYIESNQPKEPTPKSTVKTDATIAKKLNDFWPKAKWGKQGPLPVLRQSPVVSIKNTCAFSIESKHLNAFGNTYLRQNKFKTTSPIVVLEKDKPLKQLSSLDPSKECLGGYFFAAGRIFFSPTEANADISNYSIALSEDVPLKDSNGTLVWWLYRNQRLLLKLKPNKLSGRTMTLIARFHPVGHSIKKRAKRPIMKAGDQQHKLTVDENVYVGELTFTVPDKPWKLLLSSPKGGASMVIEELKLVDEEFEIDLLTVP